MPDTKISALTAVTTATSASEFAVNEAGASKKMTLAQIRASLPTLPTIASVGAEFTSTGVPTATLPGTHAANDILVLILQSSNESNITPPAGYTQLGPQNGIGAAATAGTVKLSIFWKRDNGSESAPTIPDTGDHTYGVMLAVRGCPIIGDPFIICGQAFKFTTSTTGTSDKGTTMMDNCLIMAIFGHAIDNAAAQGSSPTNADLTSVTEQFDDGTTDGTGGGIYVLTGVKANRGSFGASTVTWGTSTVDVSTVMAWLPSDSSENGRPMQVQTFIGSPPDLDDTWVKPDRAVSIRVQICDGGGSSSSGNTTTTAAGGGGGGGGGYDEASYRADDLAATVTVHAGKGGAATTVLNQAGNAGVVSEFEKGGQGPLTAAYRIAGTAATAAASADGGNGGCGSGRGTVALAAQTTRAPLEALAATNALVAYGGLGGRGGSGTTAPVGGSPADWGGGGGESGADTDAATTSLLNGYSLRGGGGGSSGRTNTNISGSGAGGGAPGVISAQGAAGTDSTHLPYGGSGGVGGGSSVVTGGNGGFPGGGGGGGAGVAGGFGGRGGHGCVVVTTLF
ncbi:MAG TPA: hypothetical protein VK467_06960 [Gemmatimonadales bacterium]|nr:hypothetical protein [Gemmatimonadales bacterium]